MINALRRSAGKLTVIAIMVTPLLAACGFHPLYGTAPSGVQLDEVLRRVSISPIPGRVGQRIRNELIFGTTGGGYADAAEYRLEIAIRESVENVVIAQTGRSEGRAYQLIALFKLVSLNDDAELIAGQSVGRAAYDNLGSNFADVRARRDAENRAAKSVAQDIQTRIATALSREV